MCRVFYDVKYAFLLLCAMEKVNFGYSLKNIPVPSNEEHRRGTILKTEDLLQRIRWLVWLFENPSERPPKETYGFKTTRNAPQSKSLIPFEHDITHLIANMEYSKQITPFQKQLANDVREIRRSNKVYVSADKTTNVYKVTKEEYNTLMRNSVTALYEKADPSIETDINLEAKRITDDLNISDRVEPIAKKNAYVTLKDHKENFPNVVKCRLINPAKSNIGKISQQLLKGINSQIREHLNLQQWRSTADTLNWFKNLKNKTRLKFIQLDIVDFYPSITEELFKAALQFAGDTVNITTEEYEILLNARQSLLFHNDTVWKKVTGLFDVTIGSYDGCELCELVGLYVLHKLKQRFPEIDFGLYRDDGLGALKRTPKTKLERLKKSLFKFFKDEFGLAITLDTDLIIVNFLDVTFDLHNEKFYPFRKPNDTPLYIHRDSNHPSHVTKQLPININKRLSEISCDAQSFNNFKGDYEKALADSSLRSKLTYEPPPQAELTPARRQRKRKVIWFTPPYCASLTTQFGKEFLNLIDKNFPKNHHLHKIINRKTVKLSYSCTPNMYAIISAHNRKVLSEKRVDDDVRCNCQPANKPSCPVPGKCCSNKVIYQATVHHTNGSSAEYVGMTEPPFKLRYGNHKKSFQHEKYKSETTLSSYVWDQGLNPTPNISWKFLKKCRVYEPGMRSCDLCLSEKEHIIKNLKKGLINKRTDVGNKCLHRRKQTLKFYDR